MISIKRKTSLKKIIIPVALIALLAVAACVWYFGFSGFTHKSTAANVSTPSINYNPPTDDQKNAGDQTKDGSVSNEGGSATTGTSTDATKDKQTVTVVIPYAAQSDGNVRITTSIATVTSQGQCVLTMTKAGSPDFTQTVDVQPPASSTTCKGFTVPVSSLASGTWNTSVAYSNTVMTGSATSQVTVE